MATYWDSRYGRWVSDVPTAFDAIGREFVRGGGQGEDRITVYETEDLNPSPVAAPAPEVLPPAPAPPAPAAASSLPTPVAEPSGITAAPAPAKPSASAEELEPPPPPPPPPSLTGETADETIVGASQGATDLLEDLDIGVDDTTATGNRVDIRNVGGAAGLAETPALTASSGATAGGVSTPEDEDEIDSLLATLAAGTASKKKTLGGVV